MNRIRYYLDKVFSGIPHSRELESLKEDIERNMENRYQDLVKEGLTDDEAASQTVTEFKSIEKIAKDLKKKSSLSSNSANLRQTNEAEVRSFLELRSHAGGMIGLGFLTILIGIGTLLLLVGLFPESDFIIMLGIILFMLSVPISLAVFLYQGFKVFRTNYFWRPFLIEESLYQKVAKMRQDDQKKITRMMIVSGGLVLLSPVPMMIGGAVTGYAEAAFAITIPVMLFMLGLAAYAFVQALFIRQAYFSILNRGKTYKKSD